MKQKPPDGQQLRTDRCLPTRSAGGLLSDLTKMHCTNEHCGLRYLGLQTCPACNSAGERDDKTTDKRTDGQMDETTYRALPAINASAISAGMTSIKAMHYVMTGGGKADTPAMAWGRKVHAAILTPDAFFGDVAIWEGAVKRGKVWDAFEAEHPNPDLIVTHDQLVDLTALSRAVWCCKDAAALLAGALTEKVLTWTDPKCGACKARVDAVQPASLTNPNATLTDLKTTKNIRPAAFWKTAEGLAYHVKMGWYARAVEQVTGTRPRVSLIVLKSCEEMDCWVADMSPGIIEQGEEEAVEIAHRYRVNESLGTFPGVVPEGTIQYERAAWVGGADGETDMSTGEMEAGEL